MAGGDGAEVLPMQLFLLRPGRSLDRESLIVKVFLSMGRLAMTPRLIVLLRHAEKPRQPDSPDSPTQPDLAQAGLERAQMLATRIPQVCGGLPDYVFAAADSSESRRPVETMRPLAALLPADRFITTIPKAEYEALANRLLTDPVFGDMCVVVCWHHGLIPDLASSLGVTKAQMNTAPEYHHDNCRGTVFDRFWLITFPGSGAAQFQSIAQ